MDSPTRPDAGAHSTTIASRWIWDGTGRAPFPGTVTVADGVIAEVRSAAASEIDTLPPSLLTVGLANAHIHLDLTVDRPETRLERPFTEWLLGVVTLRKELGDAGLVECATRGIEESLRGGVTLIFDDEPRGWSLAPLAASPIRRVVLREVIASDEERLAFESLIEFLAATGDRTRELRSITPHAPYTVTPAILDRILELCATRELPWAMHIAESTWEREFLEKGTGEGAAFLRGFGSEPSQFTIGRSAVEHLAQSGQLDRRTMVIHGNHLDDGEIALLVEHGGTVVYCPRSHAYFGHPEHPAARLIAAGVPVALGTDGKISAGSVALLEEMRAAHRAHPAVAVAEWWRAATVVPRAVLDGRFGSGMLVEGEPADLACWALDVSTSDPLRAVLEGPANSAEKTWIAGECMDRGEG